MALLCLVYGDEAGVDIDRAVRMALVHDLAEAETGDPPVRADPGADTMDPAEKRARERTVMDASIASFPCSNSVRPTRTATPRKRPS